MPSLLHLQAAACARPSAGTLDAEVAHLRLEVERGAYVAEAMATHVLDGLRAGIGELLGTDADGVALLDSATSGRDALLAAWPLPETGRVGLVPSEWGPNVEAFAARGLEPTWLSVDDDGLLDVEALDRRLGDEPLTLVNLTHVPSHRGLVQPVREALEVCRRHDVPLWVDAAQALGHLDTSYGADAAYAPSRKWLRGPRGVGVLAVAASYRDRLSTSSVRDLEPDDAHVAGRVGLAHAIAQLHGEGTVETSARLAERGSALRAAVTDLPGWSCADAAGAGTAIVSLQPEDGQDVESTQRSLLAQHSILTTACLPWRAPGDMKGPLLRLAPHVDLTDADVERVVSALAGY